MDEVNPFISYILDGDLKVQIPKETIRDLNLEKIVIIVPDDSVLDILYEDLGVRDFQELSSIGGIREALIYSSVFVFSKTYKKYISLAFIANIQEDYPTFQSPDFDEINGIKILKIGDLVDSLPSYLRNRLFSLSLHIDIQIMYIEGILLTDEAAVVIRKEFILPFKKMPIIENPSYVGQITYAIASGMFLRFLHKEDCITIPHTWNKNETDWSDIGIEVTVRTDVSEYDIKYSQNAGKYIFDCLKSKKDFSVIYLGISYYTGNIRTSGHANLLIYNRERREIERFEPHGFEGYPSDFLNKLLTNFFQKDEFKKYIDRYISPMELCPTMPKLFQAMDEKQKIQLGIYVRRGWCQTWALWYAHLRLSNRNLPQNIVIRRAMTELNESPRGFIDIARAYQTFFDRFSDKSVDQMDDKMFEQMMQEYK